MEVEIKEFHPILSVEKTTDNSGCIVTEKNIYSDETRYDLHCYVSIYGYYSNYIRSSGKEHFSYSEILSLFYLLSNILNNNNHEIEDKSWKITKNNDEIYFKLSHPNCYYGKFDLGYTILREDDLIDLYNGIGNHLELFPKKLPINKENKLKTFFKNLFRYS